MKNTKFCEKAELVGEVRPCAYDLGTINFNKKKNIRQKAYLQSWKYFQNVEQEIMSRVLAKTFKTSSPLMFSSRHFISFFPVPVKTRNKQVLVMP
jgi:hypothetical protein